jgi:hypothetical protein
MDTRSVMAIWVHNKSRNSKEKRCNESDAGDANYEHIRWSFVQKVPQKDGEKEGEEFLIWEENERNG